MNQNLHFLEKWGTLLPLAHRYSKLTYLLKIGLILKISLILSILCLKPLLLYASTNNPTLNFPVAFSNPQRVNNSANRIAKLIAADLNNDGAADLVAATDQSNEILIYQNNGRGGFPSWSTAARATSHISDLHAADLDGDGDTDLLIALDEENQIGWFENVGNASGILSQIRIVSRFTDGASAVYSADLNGDGYRDIISASHTDNRIAWYQNVDQNGTFGGQQTITTQAVGATAVYAADLDKDNDIDIISASAIDDRISWYENKGEQEKTGFGEPRTITAYADGAKAVFVADLDSDGDPDILSASQENNTIAWYENRLAEATENFDRGQSISTDTNGANAVYAADMDRDGDMDVLATALDDGQISWYMNLDGRGRFGQKRVIADGISGAAGVYAADLDGDGDHDVVSAALVTTELAVVGTSDDPREVEATTATTINWHRNETPATCNGYQRLDNTLQGADFDPGSTAWGDFDNDNDLDLLITGFDEDNQPLTQVYQNDAGTFNAVFVGLRGIDASDISWGDYDNDNDLDLLVIGLDDSVTPIARIYRNELQNPALATFIEVDANLVGVDAGDALWGDYDEDGHLDILVMGLDANKQPVTQLYRNLDNSLPISDLVTTTVTDTITVSTVITAAFEPIETDFPGLYNGGAEWADYDNDGDLDLLIAGTQQSTVPIAHIYRHDRDTISQTSTFENIAAPLTGLKEASVAWGDYDDDGYTDLLLSGLSNTNRSVAHVYHNIGGYAFALMGAGLAHAIQSSAIWLDQDQDGDLDILLIGNGDDEQPVTRIYENVGGGVFETLEFEDLNLPIGAAIWADYDLDGDNDLLFAAARDSEIGVAGLTIYRNEGCIDVTLFNNDYGLINVRGGQNIRYTLSYGNDGNRVAENAILTEIVPPNATFNATLTEQFMAEVATIENQWNYTTIDAGSVFTISLGDIEPGINGTVEFWVTLDNPLSFSSHVITNHATLNFDDVNNIEVDQLNNQSTTLTPVGRASVSGIVWEDDGNGIQELVEELPLVDAEIQFRSWPAGTEIVSTTTRADGVFVAEDLLYGEYIVFCINALCPFEEAFARVDEVGAAAVYDYSADAYQISHTEIARANSTSRPAQPGQDARTGFLVHFKSDVTEATVHRVIAMMGAELIEWLPQIGVADIRVFNIARVYNTKHDAIELIEANDSIGGTNVIEITEIQGLFDGYIPDDPDSTNRSVSYAPQNLQVFEAWRFTRGISDVVVAVLDTGLVLDHIDFDPNQIVLGPDLVNEDADPSDDNGHGTHVTGIIAASMDNGIGISGICPGCRFMPIKVLDDRNSGRWATVTKGIVEAVDRGADIINMSLAGPTPPEHFRQAIQYAIQNNVLVIAAAGNNSSDIPLYPAAYDEVVAVSATNRYDQLWPLSNYGEYVDVSAPGQSIYSTYLDEESPTEGYTYKNGTSMAAPHVAGLAGLLLSQDINRNAIAVRKLISENSKDLGIPGKDVSFGYGRINALLALDAEFDLQWFNFLPTIYKGP